MELDIELIRDTVKYLSARERGEVPPPRLDRAWMAFFERFDAFARKKFLPYGRRFDADDLRQEFWKAVVSSLARSPEFDEPAQLAAWIGTVIRCRIIDALRRRRHLDRFSSLDDDTPCAARGPSDPSEVCERMEVASRLNAIMDRLDRRGSCRLNCLLVRLTWFEGLSTSEISETLHLTKGQVRTRRHRMLTVIRSAFSEDSAAFPSAEDDGWAPRTDDRDQD